MGGETGGWGKLRGLSTIGKNPMSGWELKTHASFISRRKRKGKKKKKRLVE